MSFSFKFSIILIKNSKSLQDVLKHCRKKCVKMYPNYKNIPAPIKVLFRYKFASKLPIKHLDNSKTIAFGNKGYLWCSYYGLLCSPAAPGTGYFTLDFLKALCLGYNREPI